VRGYCVIEGEGVGMAAICRVVYEEWERGDRVPGGPGSGGGGIR
jgi:hypothetical protein